jgi:hypothetical protein
LWNIVYGDQYNWRDAIKAMESADWGIAMADRMSVSSSEVKADLNEPPKRREILVEIVSRPNTGKSGSAVNPSKTTWSRRLGYKLKWGFWHAEQILLCQIGTSRVPLLMRSTSPSEQRYLNDKRHLHRHTETAVKEE